MASNPAGSSSSTQLDHIIILLSPEQFKNVPAWLSDNFTIFEGGTHSKGTSHNKLILFKDGTYLELFSWVDPPPQGVEPYADFPLWGSKPEEHIIDWALTGNDAQVKYQEVMKTLRDPDMNQLGLTYAEPKEGGRQRKDGKELRWFATRPQQTEGGDGAAPEMPFFCHDISDRTLRVPYIEGSIDRWPEVVTHPCGAVGVAGIVVTVPTSQSESCVKLYESVLGTTSERDSNGKVSFKVPSPQEAVDANEASPATSSGGSHRPCAVTLHFEQETSTQPGHTSAIRSLSLWTDNQERQSDGIQDTNFHTPVQLLC